MKITPKQQERLGNYAFILAIPLSLIWLFVGIEYYGIAIASAILIVCGTIFNPYLTIHMKIRQSGYFLDDIGIVKKTNGNGDSRFILTFYTGEEDRLSFTFNSLEWAQYGYDKFKPEIENNQKSKTVSEIRIK